LGGSTVLLIKSMILLLKGTKQSSSA